MVPSNPRQFLLTFTRKKHFIIDESVRLIRIFLKTGASTWTDSFRVEIQKK